MLECLFDNTGTNTILVLKTRCTCCVSNTPLIPCMYCVITACHGKSHRGRKKSSVLKCPESSVSDVSEMVVKLFSYISVQKRTFSKTVYELLSVAWARLKG